MIKDLIQGIKNEAMEVVAETKTAMVDTIATSQLKAPNEFEKSMAKATDDLSYMSGWNGQNQVTALQIDMISNNMAFVAQQIQQGLLSFDSIEEELRNQVKVGQPPQPSQLLNWASRIDSSQRQVLMGLQTLKDLSVQVDKATDKLQGGANAQGWGSKNIGGIGTGW